MQFKIMKKAYIGLLLFVCCLYLFPTSLLAMDIKVSRLEPGKKQSVKTNPMNYYYYDDSPVYYLYSVTTSAIGYISLNTDGGYNSLLVFDEKENLKEKENLVLTCYPSSDKTKNTFQIAVEKGQYYIAVESNLNPNISLKYNFKKVKPKANYCKAKATLLKKGKKVTICSSLYHEYDRWYKIRLTHKDAITLKSTEPLYNFKMYNSRRKEIALDSAGSKSVGYMGTTFEKLPKGTYYLKIPAMENLDVVQICLQ